MCGCEVEDAVHEGGEAAPVGDVAVELGASGDGDGVELGLALVVGDAPLGGDPTALLEADEGGVDGALVEEDFVAGNLLDAACDAVAMEGSKGGEGLEDHEVQGALEEFEAGFFRVHVGCPQEYTEEEGGSYQLFPRKALVGSRGLNTCTWRARTDACR